MDHDAARLGLEDERRMIKAPQQLLFLVSGVSFLTLLVNGWTSAPLLERLEMTIPSEDTVHLRAYAKRKANAQAARTYRRIIGDYGFVLGDAPGEPASPKKDFGATASSRWHAASATRSSCEASPPPSAEHPPKDGSSSVFGDC